MKPYAVTPIFLLLFIFSCSPVEESVEKLNRGDGIIGLASPVKMNPDTTSVFLLDYFELGNQIDSVWFDSDAEFELDTSSSVIKVTAYNGPPVSNLSIIYDGKDYDLPVFRSKKQKYTFSYQGQTEAVSGVGMKANFNGWNASANPLEKQGDKWITTLFLEPGLYEYLIVEDGEEMLDSNNPDKKDNGMGGFNSVLSIGSVTEPEHIAANRFTEDSIYLFYPENLAEPLIYWENKLLDAKYFNRTGTEVSLALEHFNTENKRTHIRVYGQSENVYTNDLLIYQ